MSIAKHHAEWLSLIEVSGPFLSLPVLVQRFPQGMDAHDPEHAKALRQVHEEWDQDQNGDRPDPAIHRQWIDWVLRNTLDLGDVLVEGQKIPQTLKADLAEHGETLRPDKVVMEPDGGKARLLIQTYPLKQKLSRVVEGKPWAASPDTRMMQLLHDTGVRIGLVTNGDQWMLVDAPKGETTGYASWYASLWLEEPKTLQAFRTLLGSYRFFGVPEEETLERLLAQSAQDQQEVTDQLGYQVRQAVEVLVHTLDRANRDSGGALLKGVPEDKLYDAALTVMMRLVFLFCAEERDLLLLGDELYDKNYSVSTLREQLRVTATNFGEEVLERRHDAWSRLLTTFRAVYGGIQHERSSSPPIRGNCSTRIGSRSSKGEKPGRVGRTRPASRSRLITAPCCTCWNPSRCSRSRLPGGGPATPRKLSFRALSILQIGHVYEGLLDHTAVKATEPVLGLNGPRDNEPEVPLSKLEALAAKGEDELAGIRQGGDGTVVGRHREAAPGVGTGRPDTEPIPHRLPGGREALAAGQAVCRAGAARHVRLPGRHPARERLRHGGHGSAIQRHTLHGRKPDQADRAVHAGAARLRRSSRGQAKGAVAVEVAEGTSRPQDLRHGVRERGVLGPGLHLPGGTAARSLGGSRETGEGSPRITPYGEVSTGLPDEQLIPLDRQERLTYARRLVAERCVYGVDKNPLAVEMAKLSLWLLTLAKDKPFTFLDHAIRCGDSLVGLSSIDQLLRFSLTENVKVRPLLEQQRQQIEKRLQATMLLRKQIETRPRTRRRTSSVKRKCSRTSRIRRSGYLCRRHAPGGYLGGEERRRVGVSTQRDAGRGRVQIQGSSRRAVG